MGPIPAGSTLSMLLNFQFLFDKKVQFSYQSSHLVAFSFSDFSCYYEVYDRPFWKFFFFQTRSKLPPRSTNSHPFPPIILASPKLPPIHTPSFPRFLFLCFPTLILPPHLLLLTCLPAISLLLFHPDRSFSIFNSTFQPNCLPHHQPSPLFLPLFLFFPHLHLHPYLFPFKTEINFFSPRMRFTNHIPSPPHLVFETELIGIQGVKDEL